MFVRLAKALYGARVLALGRRKDATGSRSRHGRREVIFSAEPGEPWKTCASSLAAVARTSLLKPLGSRSVGDRCQVPAPRRNRQLFRRLPNNSKIQLDTQLLHYSEITCKASFHHTPEHYPPGRSILSAGVCHGARLRESRGTAYESVGSDAALDEPQRPYEDRYHTVVPLLRTEGLCQFRPEALSGTYTQAEAEQYTRWLATHHYENFHVVSFLLPKRLHQDFYNVYSFCRWADDLGDEIGDTSESLRLLGWWRDELEAMYLGRAASSLCCAGRHGAQVRSAEAACSLI